MSVNAASSSATVLVLSMWRFNSENVRVDSPSWSSPLVSTCNVLVMCKISTRDGARRRAAVTSRACVTAIDEEELMLSVNTGRDRCLGHVHADSGAFCKIGRASCRERVCQYV